MASMASTCALFSPFDTRAGARPARSELKISQQGAVVARSTFYVNMRSTDQGDPAMIGHCYGFRDVPADFILSCPPCPRSSLLEILDWALERVPLAVFIFAG